MVSSPSTPWQGQFKSWQDAARYSEERNGASVFDSTGWLSRQREMLEVAQQGVLPRPTNLPALADFSRAKFIVDWGGGSGWTYHAVKNASSHNVEKYIVVERPYLVAKFTTEKGLASPVRFDTSDTLLTQSIRACEIVYTNSVLQYFPDNRNLVEIIEHVSPRFVLLDDVLTSRANSLFSTQHYYGHRIPVRFLSIANLKEEMWSAGYRLARKTRFRSGVNMGFLRCPEFPIARHPDSFLFERKSLASDSLQRKGQKTTG